MIQSATQPNAFPEQNKAPVPGTAPELTDAQKKAEAEKTKPPVANVKS